MGVRFSYSIVIIFFFGNFADGVIATTVYFRTQGVKLNAPIIAETKNITGERCLGVCLRNVKCLAFNAIPGTVSIPPRCEFFDKDKCSLDVTLFSDDNVSYFDTIGDKNCRSMYTYNFNFLPFYRKYFSKGKNI